MASAADGEPVLVAAKKKKKKADKDKKAKKATTPPPIEKGMKVVTLDKTAVLDEGSEDGEEVFSVKEGEVLTVKRVKKGGVWVKVADKDGQTGWVRSAEVVPKEFLDAQAKAAEEEEAEEDEEDEEEEEGKFSKGGKFKKGGSEEDEEDEEDDDEEDEETAAKKDKKGKKDKKDKKVAKSDDDDEEDEEDEEEDDEEDEDGEDGGKVKKGKKKGGASFAATLAPDGKIRYAAGASLSFLSRAQSFSSMGTGAISNYEIDNASPVLSAYGRIARRSGRYELGGELGLLTTFGNEGVSLPDAGMTMAEPLAWTLTQIDVRLLGGYHLDGGYLVSARLGYRRMATTIDVSQVIKQPSERLSGFAIGAEATAFKLYPKLVARLGVETLVGAELIQTTGFEDGDSSTVKPYYLFLEACYTVAPKIEATAGYTLAYETYSFTGTSVRDAANVGGKRKDLQHLIGVGAIYWF